MEIGRLSLILILLLIAHRGVRAEDDGGIGATLSQIGALERRFDPKCHATASRLEDFMYGTPLDAEARRSERLRQSGFVERLLRQAGAGDAGRRTQAEAIGEAMSSWVVVSVDRGGGRGLQFPSGENIELSARDLRQYASVAYSLRAILALQQRSLIAGVPLPPMDEASVKVLKDCLDLASLAVLQSADREARRLDAHEVSDAMLEAAWARLFPPGGDAAAAPEQVPRPPASAGLSAAVIREKVEAYGAYNQISNQLFVRNMQVYFSRLSWPRGADEARLFKAQFIESVTQFAVTLYQLSDRRARQSGHPLILEQDVGAAVRSFVPHSVNDFEDVVFFPGLPRAEQVAIESYDMDAFRDSGNHWRYLGFALEEAELEGALEADPFALELLAENIAQFGVLVLRVAGEEGVALGRERLSSDLLERALKSVQRRVSQHAALPSRGGEGAQILSVVGEPLPDTDPGLATATMFEEVTDSCGVDYHHRSSDWLNRLLRSYLQKGEDTGVITIPPAFGGSGIAAEDIDGDGLADLLLLGGRGAKLYKNLGDGTFRDITGRSGLGFRRPVDKQAGEMRQALIADLDNDGHQDVFISYVDDAHRLYRGRGDGTFDDVTSGAALGGEGLVGGPATSFDYDNDGLLDLYVVYFGNYLEGVLPTLSRRNRNGLPNRLFRNLGGMRFEDVTEQAGVGDTGWGQAVLHSDLDGDGRQDLIAGNDFGVNAYYRNDGDGTFSEVAAELGTDRPSYTMSLSASDLNGDLLPDIYVSNIVTMNKDEKYVLPNEDTRMKFDIEKLAQLRVVEANDLFLSRRGDGGGLSYSPSPEVLSRGHSSTGWSWDADFFDCDHDGDDDLYVLNGMNEFNIYSSRNPYFMDPGEQGSQQRIIPVAATERNVFFLNEGGGLRNRTEVSGLGLDANSRSAAYFDLEGDGDLDIAISNYHGPAQVFRNNLVGGSGQRGNWIKLKLLGAPEHRVNRDAIGARLIIELPGSRTVRREIHGSTGYLSAHPKVVHAGTGKAATVDLTVIWPNGRTQRLTGLATNRLHRIAYQPEP